MENINSNKRVYRFFKRCFDIVCSAFAIILLSPVYIILSIIVKCTSKGPVFYSHKRIGKNGKEIGILKFRSMVKNADQMIDDFNDKCQNVTKLTTNFGDQMMAYLQWLFQDIVKM